MHRLFFLSFCIVMMTCLSSCKAEEQSSGKMPAAYVSVRSITAEDVPWPSEYQAIAAGSRAVDVRARVQGIIEKRYYKEGDFIKAGQLMFQLERNQYEAIFEQARAAYSNADREWKRIRPLYAANAVSQKDRDQALSNYESTKAAMRQAQINLDYCQVVSPVSGFTSKENYTVGNLVANNSLLTTVNQTDPMYIDFSIAATERMLRQQLQRSGRLKFPEGGHYNARLRLLDGRMFEGRGVIDFIDSQVEPTMGVIKARATFSNADGQIMPGQYVRIYMDGDVLINAVLVPQTSVLITNQGCFVMLVDANNVVKRIPVELGPAIGKNYLVNSGLKGGEKIVVDGIIKVREGATVRYDIGSEKNGKGSAAAENGTK